MQTITVTESEVMRGTLGACLSCGEQAEGVEPDARGYECDACGKPHVYGLEELLIMGRLEID